MGELIPELHDVVKLTRLPHDIFEWSQTDFDRFAPLLKSAPVLWASIVEHHCSDIKMGYPTKADSFYLCLADGRAAAFSREAGQPGEGLDFRINKLWRPEKEAPDPRLDSDEDIAALFKFCSTLPTWEAFAARYQNVLRDRAEDAGPGKNVTSLQTHCKLTGQFYRILRSVPEFLLTDGDLQGKSKREVQVLRDKVSNAWQLTVARCRFRFMMHPFRARDLNAFQALDELVADISARYPDNLFFRTSDAVVLVLPKEEQLADIAKTANERGFLVEVIKSRRGLREIKPDPQEMAQPKRDNLYSFPDHIVPPICDLCQAARAIRRWPEDYVISRRGLCDQCSTLLAGNRLASVADSLCEDDRVKLEDILAEPAGEELCPTCFDLRSMDVRLPKLSAWSEAGTKVAWLRLYLDYGKLTEALKQLSPGLSEDSFSLIGELQADYSAFLAEMRKRIIGTFRSENTEVILEDFFCVQVERIAESLGLLRIYRALLSEYFPAFLNLRWSPLKLGLVCCAASYPFFQVWTLLEKPEEDILVSLPGRGSIRASINALEPLVRASGLQYRSSAVHKLAKIAETSETLAELSFGDRSARMDYPTYAALGRELRPAVDFRSILTFVKLLGG